MTKTKSDNRINDIRQFFLSIEHIKQGIDRVDENNAGGKVSKVSKVSKVKDVIEGNDQDTNDLDTLTFQIGSTHITKPRPLVHRKQRRVPMYLRTGDIDSLSSVFSKLWGRRYKETA